jgi:hypothetical protein
MQCWISMHHDLLRRIVVPQIVQTAMPSAAGCRAWWCLALPPTKSPRWLSNPTRRRSEPWAWRVAYRSLEHRTFGQDHEKSPSWELKRRCGQMNTLPTHATQPMCGWMCQPKGYKGPRYRLADVQSSAFIVYRGLAKRATIRKELSRQLNTLPSEAVGRWLGTLTAKPDKQTYSCMSLNLV